MSQFRNLQSGANKLDFINKAIEAYMRVSRTAQAKELFTTAVGNGLHPDHQTIVALLDGFLKHSEMNRAKEIMKSLEAYGLKPNIRIMNLWMRYYLRDQQLGKAMALYEGLAAQGLTASQTTYLNFIRFYIRDSDFGAARKWKSQMLESGVIPTVSFYNAILQSLFQRQAQEEVEAVLREMDERALQPNESTCNILIEGYAGLNRLDKSQELLNQMPAIGITPSIVTFNRLLSSQSHSLDVEQTKGILVQMNNLGLEFNAYTYAALFRGLIAKGRLQEAVSMLLRMEENKVALPVEVFTDLVKLCCEHNLEAAVYLLRTQLVKHDISTSSPVYAVLIKYYLRHRNYPQVDGLLLEMQRTRGILPGIHIFSTLLNHHVEHLDVERIRKTLEQMRTLRLDMNRVVYNVVMKAFYVHCKCLDGGLVYRCEVVPATGESEPGKTAPMELISPSSRRTSVSRLRREFEATFGIPFRPSVHVFNDLMNNFFLAGRYVETLECFEELLECDLLPNLTTMTVAIKARLYLGQTDSARALFATMRRYGLTPTILQAALIHHSYCRQLLVEEAESFLAEVATAHKLTINFVFYASLLYAYSRRMDHFNVFRTLERLETAGLRPDTEACNYVLMSYLCVGQVDDALRFFKRMCEQGVRRNSYTYIILTNWEAMQSNAVRSLELLADCMLPGNTIDAFPFNRIAGHFYDRSEMGQVARVIRAMDEYSIRYSWETWQYVSYLFYRSIDALEDLPFARRLLEKALIDLEGIDDVQPQMVDALRQAYVTVGGQEEALASLDQFLERLPEYREKIANISPALREVINHTEAHRQEILNLRSEGDAEDVNQADNEIRHELGLMSSATSPPEDEMMSAISKMSGRDPIESPNNT